MNGNSNGNWTDAQRQLIEQTIQDEVEDSRLAHKIIPEYSLVSSARAVAADTFNYVTNRVDDETQLALEERQNPFSLTRQQAEDNDLSSAVVVIRRATQRLAIDHDTRVFQIAIRDRIDTAALVVAAGAALGADAAAVEAADAAQASFNPIQDVERNGDSGEGMVAATAAAVATLDGEGYRTGYVLIAGTEIYKRLHTRAVGAADLPIVAVRGLLDGGPVHRSTVLPTGEALVMSVGAGRVDRAVAVRPSIEFLRIEAVGGDELRLLRVYERFLTRFKETKSAALLRLEAAPAAPAARADEGGADAGGAGAVG
jgi:hypothetical protein